MAYFVCQLFICSQTPTHRSYTLVIPVGINSWTRAPLPSTYAYTQLRHWSCFRQIQTFTSTPQPPPLRGKQLQHGNPQPSRLSRKGKTDQPCQWRRWRGRQKDGGRDTTTRRRIRKDDWWEVETHTELSTHRKRVYWIRFVKRCVKYCL